MTSHTYRGRFAPSPTGPLHFGSLLAALASYLDARAHGGTWLVRMEDLDPPREQAGAAEHILHALSVHGLNSDEPVLYQSHRLPAYEQQLHALTARGLVYPCNCNRARLQVLGRVYDRHCLHNPPTGTDDCALRLKIPYPDQPVAFNDRIQGPQQQTPAQDFGDYILKRKDGLHAYQLAVVVDDIFQHITHVVRGSDLLDVSARQQSLFSILGQTAPAWAHIPVINNDQGQKLSKQNHAPALDLNCPTDNLWHALRLLGQSPEPTWQTLAPDALLMAATPRWDLKRVPRRMAITDPAYSR
ncbi:tRNA glutamyl-Q(34) synthetase GluQRS [Simiduia agarivorans]|uniref:Glutamyl-Q tRNA(Asp) synthetase n=1 Tax=Simiduia agarivorans (strain DSM 21679 / JCM 13881 / BCRC 17597 / SA1) TaxID=1117647 RepID=K4KHT2_SIMAS|nr:tRNA glutamyl-Q(34) synthetase GluQRS [Simiduia agarivorans]AFU98649.1 glutamyl- and glutaminyl-tRNA synthetase [Simiduia agarivorans SA1 = DSM 21679]